MSQKPPLERDVRGSLDSAHRLVGEMLFEMGGQAPEGEHYHYETGTVYACRKVNVVPTPEILKQRGWPDTTESVPACDNVWWFSKRAACIFPDWQE